MALGTKELFDLSNSAADFICENEEALKTFLSSSPFVSNYSIANKILIISELNNNMGCKPLLVKDAEEWARESVSIRPNETPIYVLKKCDNKKGYEPREVFDIRQTNATINPPKYVAEDIIDNLIVNSPCPIEYSETMRVRGTKAYYEPTKNIINVSKGFKDYEHIIRGLIQEYAHFYMAKEYFERNKKEGESTTPIYPRASCMKQAQFATYMFLSYFGLNTEQIAIESIANETRGLDVFKKKEALLELTMTGSIIVNNFLESYNVKGSDAYAVLS